MNGKLQIETISSVVLKDNPLGDPRRREIPVYLPPSYGAKRGRRYPVIVWLPGFTGTGRGAVNFNPWKEILPERFDRLIAEGKAREAILVIADGFTAYGGSQYLNSGATGRYEDFVVSELIAFVEDKFAAVGIPEGRALAGSSSGGFGALTLGMRHPDVFAHVVSHSGDAGFDTCYGADFAKLCVAADKFGGLEKLVAAYPETKYKSAHINEPPSDNRYNLFDCAVAPETGIYLSEDYTFCQRWRKLGGKVWLDMRSPLKHVGAYEFQGTPVTVKKPA